MTTAAPGISRIGHGTAAVVGGRAGWLLAEAAAGPVGTVLATLLVAGVVGPAATGLAALASAAVMLVQPVCASPFTSALVQRRSLAEGEVAAASGLVFATSVALAGLVAALGLAAGDALAPGAGILLAVLSLVLPASAVDGIATGLLLRRADARALALRAVAGHAAGILVGVGLAAAGGGAWSLVGQQLAFFTVTAGLAAALVPLRPGTWSLRVPPPEMRRFALASIGTALAHRGGFRVFLLLVGAGAPPALVGVLQMGFRLTEMARELPVSLIQRLALPTLSRLQGRPELRRRRVEALLLVSGLGLAPAFAGLALTARELQSLLLGPTWTGILEPVRILAVAAAIGAARLPVPTVLTAAGHPGATLRFTLAGMAAAMLAACLWTPAEPAVAAALWLPSAVVPLLLGLGPVARRLHIPVARQLRIWAVSLVPALAMAAALLALEVAGAWPAAPLAALLAKLALGATVALPLAAMLGGDAWRALGWHALGRRA